MWVYAKVESRNKVNCISVVEEENRMDCVLQYELRKGRKDL